MAVMGGLAGQEAFQFRFGPHHPRHVKREKKRTVRAGPPPPRTHLFSTPTLLGLGPLSMGQVCMLCRRQGRARAVCIAPAPPVGFMCWPPSPLPPYPWSLFPAAWRLFMCLQCMTDLSEADGLAASCCVDTCPAEVTAGKGHETARGVANDVRPPVLPLRGMAQDLRVAHGKPPGVECIGRCAAHIYRNICPLLRPLQCPLQCPSSAQAPSPC